MKIIFFRMFYLQSITVLLGTVMLLSCKNDMQQVHEVADDVVRPEMTGRDLVMIYSDSARIRYKMITPEYVKVTQGDEKYEEFPQGIYVISYDADEKEMGSIRSKYAKNREDGMLWEARNEVIVVNAEGKKLETELLYWDRKKEKIYSDRYARLTDGGQILEGNNGFESDQNLNNPVFYGITGKVEFEKQKP